MTICTPDDLYTYSCATQNNGVTYQQISMYETALFYLLWGHQAAVFKEYLVTNVNCIEEPPVVTPSDLPFGGTITDEVTVCTYGDLTTLINGDGILFEGMRPICANYVVLCIMSMGKILISRQSTNVKGTYAQDDLKVQEKQQVNGIAITLRNLVFEMQRFLNVPANNPLNLCVKRNFQPVPYMVVESGLPWMNQKGWGSTLFGGFGGFY